MRLIYFLTLLLMFCSCGKSKSSDTTKDKNDSTLTQSKETSVVKKIGLQKIDYSDPFYGRFLIDTTNDTITKSGFSIEYFVLDSTKHDDLYIVWGNDQFKDTFEYKQVLAMGDYEYVPSLVEETDNHLILNYDCSQMDCSGSLLLSKKEHGGARNFQGVLRSYFDRGYIVYNDAVYTSTQFDFYIYDLVKDDTMNIMFGNEVMFDSCFIKNNSLTLIAKEEEDSKKKFKMTVGIRR